MREKEKKNFCFFKSRLINATDVGYKYVAFNVSMIGRMSKLILSGSRTAHVQRDKHATAVRKDRRGYIAFALDLSMYYNQFAL